MNHYSLDAREGGRVGRKDLNVSSKSKRGRDVAEGKRGIEAQIGNSGGRQHGNRGGGVEGKRERVKKTSRMKEGQTVREGGIQKRIRGGKI